MAVYCEFINFIIPIKTVDAVYPGGFEQYKKDNPHGFAFRMWHDDFLLRDGAMSPLDMADIVESWEKLGLQGSVEVDGKKQWKDFCVVEAVQGGPTLPCDWVEFDPKDDSVYIKGAEKGEVVWPNKE